MRRQGFHVLIEKLKPDVTALRHRVGKFPAEGDTHRLGFPIITARHPVDPVTVEARLPPEIDVRHLLRLHDAR